MAVKEKQVRKRCRSAGTTKAPGSATGEGKRIRTARAKASVLAEEPEKSMEPPLRPAQCRAYMRRTLAGEFREIVAGFVKGARSGSCQHVKLAAEFLEPRARKTKAVSGRSTLERWVDELERGV